MNLHEQARANLNTYLAQELGRSVVLQDSDEIAEHRQNFLDHFGPETLQGLSDEELLRELPFNAVNAQPMDYWLEFKNTDDFKTRLFGSIGGGSATKYGTWQSKETGDWMRRGDASLKSTSIPVPEALEILRTRRDELLASVATIRGFEGRSAEDIDPASFQKAIEHAAPTWASSAWLHKYLHIVFPDRATWGATGGYSASELYRMGVHPIFSGVYAQDVQIIRFWNSLPALSLLEIEERCRVSRALIPPRDYWRVELTDSAGPLQDMLAQGRLMLGPSTVESLDDASAFKNKGDIQQVIHTAFVEAGLSASSPAAASLTELHFRLREGAIIALFSDASTIAAVGEVTGNYGFVEGAAFPHQLAVRWLHNHAFTTSKLIKVGRGLTPLNEKSSTVADIESSLLCFGGGPWPNFDEVMNLKPIDLPDNVPATIDRDDDSPAPTPAPMPSLEGIAQQVIDMLDRKRQVILYGPPGTGKTYHAERVALEMVARENFSRSASQLKSSERDTIFGRADRPPYIETCTFHPMYSYEDFIEGYRPDGTGFVLEAGIFKRMATAASKEPDKRFVLIIDEINRGNIPKIFGELITLIEASKRGTTAATLPLSKTRFTVPDNLYVIGTMNTADRSILLLDTALRRRFAFKELLPDPQLLRDSYIGDVRLSTWLRALNRRIVEQLGRDGRNLQVGHAYLMHRGKPAATLSRIGEIVRDEVWPLLQEYCYDDPNKLANILGGGRHSLYDRDKSDLRYGLFEPNRQDDLIQALLAIITPDDKADDVAILEEDLEGDDSFGDGDTSADDAFEGETPEDDTPEDDTTP